MHLPDTLEILLGSTTAQDLLLDLGPPLRKFYKEDNRLERMWAAAESPGGSCELSCLQSCRVKCAGFWNYFQYGLDFLIDSEGIIIKVICHSNIVGAGYSDRRTMLISARHAPFSASCSLSLETDHYFNDPVSHFLTVRHPGSLLRSPRDTNSGVHR